MHADSTPTLRDVRSLIDQLRTAQARLAERPRDDSVTQALVSQELGARDALISFVVAKAGPAPSAVQLEDGVTLAVALDDDLAAWLAVVDPVKV